ncbi:Reverse transcriptase domain-containing protein [Aphis craccivora]|uniref:Reverse transcriptase domain-containing protein n=1 Tax=Aphis craccivora TaxID=307492 RepID=A0A6G0YK08_APHCR|nr:Reverse transcriptase domain-containing protein [Aphis craccivora]
MNNLKLLSLADRRVEATLAFLLKLIDRRVDAPVLLFVINFKVPTHLTRSNSSFVVPFHSTNYGRNNPIHCMMRICNEHLGFF